MSPRFFSQKMLAKDPEKKMPSTAAKATRRSAKESVPSIQRIAHFALRSTAGIVSTASNRCRFWSASFT